MDVVFGILGRTAIAADDHLNDDWGPPRLRAVLATLLVHTGRAVSVDTLLAWAWPEEELTPQNPAATFHTYATRIRRSLRRLTSPPNLHVENGCYWLDLDKSLIDYGYFRTLTSRAREHARLGNYRDTADCAANALKLWRGRGLDDLTSEPARAWRTSVLRDEWIPANVIHIEALLKLGEFDEALTQLDDLKNDHDNDVTLAKLRLSALHGLSRYSEETAHYLGMRRLLLNDSDDQAAQNLREHHESLRAPSTHTKAELLPEANAIPRQIPHDIGNFVGRHRLIQELDAAMRDNFENMGGVVIIDGMAGVGKTALAVHWAHRMRSHFPDGDFFINLNGFSEEEGITQSVAVDELLIALGYPLVENLLPRSKELILKRLIANRRALVILDNARSTAHIKELVSLLPGCSIIVTSRQQLTTLSTSTGARRVHANPMTSAESTDLFSRLLGDRHRIALDDQVHLATLCGGLPLVITVLAQHIASRPAADLATFAQQLDRQQLLTDIGEDGDGSTTAETFFLWSYRALAPPEQRLFRLLGLNPGSSIGEKTIQACDDRADADVKRSLRILVTAHLLEQPKTFDRYQFHDLIREFARHRAIIDEPPASRATAELRLLSHYLMAARQAHRTLYPGNLIADEISSDIVESATLTDHEAAKAWFDHERVNLVAAIRFAAIRGYHEHAWRITDAAGAFLDRQGYYDESRIVRQLSVESARAVGHRVGEASSLVGLGMVQIILGDLVNARSSLEVALQLVEADGNERGQASTLHQLGQLELMRGNLAAAVGFYERCLNIAQRTQDSEALCWTHCHLAETLRMLGEHEKALVHLHQSQFHAQRIGDTSAQASCLVEIGSVYHDRDSQLTAAAHCEQALDLIEAMPIPDLAIMTSACIALAEIHNKQDNIEIATGYILRGIEVAQRTHNTTAQARAHDVYGDIQFVAREPAAAQTWKHAADLYSNIGNTRRAAAIHSKISALPPEGTHPVNKPD